MSNRVSRVIPAQAVIQGVRLQRTSMEALDPRLRGDDDERKGVR